MSWLHKTEILILDHQPTTTSAINWNLIDLYKEIQNENDQKAGCGMYGKRNNQHRSRDDSSLNDYVLAESFEGSAESAGLCSSWIEEVGGTGLEVGGAMVGGAEELRLGGSR